MASHNFLNIHMAEAYQNSNETFRVLFPQTTDYRGNLPELINSVAYASGGTAELCQGGDELDIMLRVSVVKDQSAAARTKIRSMGLNILEETELDS